MLIVWFTAAYWLEGTCLAYGALHGRTRLSKEKAREWHSVLESMLNLCAVDCQAYDKVDRGVATVAQFTYGSH